MYRILFLIGLFVVLSSSIALAVDDQQVSEIKRSLANEGFLDVNCVFAEDSVLIVAFENDPYRFEVSAIQKAINLVYPYSRAAKTLVVIVNKLKIPMVQIVISVDDLQEFAAGLLSELEFKNKLQIGFEYSYAKFLDKRARVNKSIGNVDVIIEPKVGLNLGSYDYPFRYFVNLNPGLKIHLWKGAYFAPKFNLPFFDFKLDLKYNTARPEDISLNQFFKLGKSMFVRVSGGLFAKRRYGVETEFGKYFYNGRLFVRTKVGYTGSAIYLKPGVSGITNDIYDEPTMEITPISYLSYKVNVSYRISKYDLAVDMGYGRYLNNHKALDVIVYRQFSEYLLGFRAIKSTNGDNYGFIIHIPLAPKKYIVNTKFNIKPSKYINYSYLATSDFVDSFEAGVSINDLILDINPEFLKNYLANNLFYIERNIN